MKYISLLVWSAILFSVLNYVVSAINNVEFSVAVLQKGLIYSVVFAVFVLIVSAIIPNESPKEFGAKSE